MSEFFSALYGNEATKARLGAAIRNGSLPHAFLISGPEGSGKRTLAKEIAAALNCESSGRELPCHRCNNCRRIMDDGYTDVKRLERPKDKATIGVGEVRLFREDMFLSSTESEYKIYIIDDAQRMTPNAQNALLKVIEEPPERVVIMLLTDSDDAILTTIKSRTQYVAMERFDEDGLLDYFKKRAIALPVGEEKEMLMCADGRIGRALELCGTGAKDALDLRRQTESFISALRHGVPYSELYSVIKELPTKKDELSEAFENIQEALRDLILLKYDPSAPLVFYPSRQRASEVCSGIYTSRLLRIYDIIGECLEELSKNVNVAAMTTSLGARIILI